VVSRCSVVVSHVLMFYRVWRKSSKMSEMALHFYEITQHHIPENSHLHRKILFYIAFLVTGQLGGPNSWKTDV
jgi:hypothetical protein